MSSGGASAEGSGGALTGTGGGSGGAAVNASGGSISSIGGSPPFGNGGTGTGSEVSYAVPVDITMAAAAGPLIQAIAQSHVPVGAKPFGAPFAGQFQEGQVLRQRLELNPGHCYSALAAGLSPLREIRLAFYLVDPQNPEGILSPALLEEETPGAQAVLGRKETCLRSTPSQTQVWLYLVAEKGQGVAAGQVFEK